MWNVDLYNIDFCWNYFCQMLVYLPLYYVVGMCFSQPFMMLVVTDVIVPSIL